MGRPLTYVPVPVQLCRALERSRRKGRSFETAWFSATRLDCDPLITMETPTRERKDAIAWPTDTDERQSWVAVTIAMKDVWRRAYDRLPPTAAESGMMQLWGEINAAQLHSRLEELALIKAA